MCGAGLVLFHLIHNKFRSRVSVHRLCYVRPWLIEFSGVALSSFRLSRFSIVPDVSLIKPEDSIVQPSFRQFFIQCHGSEL